MALGHDSGITSLQDAPSPNGFSRYRQDRETTISRLDGRPGGVCAAAVRSPADLAASEASRVRANRRADPGSSQALGDGPAAPPLR
jgi:hypothetical protein